MEESIGYKRDSALSLFKTQLRRFLHPKMLLAIFVITGLYLYFGCPIRYFTGIACPGCGMTRAVFSIVTFHFAEAIHYHPLVVTLPFICFFWFFQKRFPSGTRWRIYLIISASILFITVYLYRMLSGESEIVNIIAPPVWKDINKLIQLWRNF